MDHTEHTGIFYNFLLLLFALLLGYFVFYSSFIFINFSVDIFILSYYCSLKILGPQILVAAQVKQILYLNLLFFPLPLSTSSFSLFYFPPVISSLFFFIFFLWCKYFFVTIADLWRIASLFWLKLQVRGGILLLFRSFLHLFLPSLLPPFLLSLSLPLFLLQYF